MGNIRYETAYASAAFVEELRQSQRLLQMRHNGIDIVLFDVAGEGGRQSISVHFIDSALPLYEIRKTLHDNARQGIATLFLLWAEMMLPTHGQCYRADDWMEALYTLYGNTIYAYELIEGEVFLFPVYFRGEGLVRTAEYGTVLHFANLTTRRLTTHLAGLAGEWYVADFGGVRGTAHDPKQEAVLSAELSQFYTLLGVTPDDDEMTVKKAYRVLARRYHPDLNAAPDAHDQMQQLNAAYNRIMAYRAKADAGNV